MICEYCNKKHDGSYGSGRFCCQKCARGYSTKKKRKEINRKISNTLIRPLLKKECPFCHSTFEVKIYDSQICCSRSCAQRYKHRDKISKKLYHKICFGCNNAYTTADNRQKYCSRVCSSKYGSHSHLITKQGRKNISAGLKKAYIDGKRKVYGGTAKWHSIETSMGNIKVQGSYEVRICNILDRWLANGKIINWGYAVTRIPYIGEDNKKHTYIIDFKVTKNNKSKTVYYIEAKGYVRENDLKKWEAANKIGLKLYIWYLKQIERYEKN